MKKIFISQPMRNKTQDEIMSERRRAIGAVTAKLGDAVECIDSYFPEFDGNRIAFLGKSIGAMSNADLVVFIGEWYKTDGCISEFLIASRYGLKCYFVENE